ncbi:CrcB family protein [Halobacillus sp. Marseille-Q1614]|uniref:fluoride efflux transporter FluC n=1 Tax=Halobacillus sp. Marseille-Q1614 TaxID=2709134 RepID=UPI00156FC7FD|nr:CrcB family protein [Halobacillus sp. Marseille-Q1614]
MLASFLLVGLGGFIGAVLRFFISQYAKKKRTSRFPAATFFVNTTGSFWLGLLTGLNVSSGILLFLGTGVLGAFTTFSTFKLESIQLQKDRLRKTLVIYTVLSYAAGIVFALIGLYIGTLLK